MASKTALAILAEGAEEMETVIVVDVLRRAQIEVTLANLEENPQVLCSRNIKIVADRPLKEVTNEVFDAVILPGGGKGAQSLAASSQVGEILKNHQKEGKVLAAVCAAPTAFLAHDIGKGGKLTSYPAFKEKLEKDYEYSEDRVVVDGKMVTSRGPGTCFEFAFKLAEILVSKEMADQLRDQTLAL